MENFLTPACDECGSPVPNHNQACSRWSCPSCAVFLAKLDREKMESEILKTVWTDEDNWALNVADTLIAYFKE